MPPAANAHRAEQVSRFKSFPVQTGEHLLKVLRYIERNALRASLVEQADRWPHGSLHRRRKQLPTPWLTPPEAWPVGVAWSEAWWQTQLDRPQSAADVARLQASLWRGSPFGDDDWCYTSAESLNLKPTMRRRGRPRKLG